MLPSVHKKKRTVRGPLSRDGKPNPNPIRTLPWGTAETSYANLRDTGDQNARWIIGTQRSSAITASPKDLSDEGVLNLAGNVLEWTRTEIQPGFYATRGCSWSICTQDTLVNTLAVPNMRLSTLRFFELGARCVVEGPRPNSDCALPGHEHGTDGHVRRRDRPRMLVPPGNRARALDDEWRCVGSTTRPDWGRRAGQGATSSANHRRNR